MSSFNHVLNAETTDILCQNALAIVLTKSHNLIVTRSTSAMVRQMPSIEKNNPEFTYRLYLVAMNIGAPHVFQAFLEDFRFVSSFTTDFQLVQIDFRFLVDIPKHEVLYAPSSDLPAAVRRRNKLIAMMYFILAFPQFFRPVGLNRTYFLELIAAFNSEINQKCLRIFCNHASQQDVRSFDRIAALTACRSGHRMARALQAPRDLESYSPERELEEEQLIAASIRAVEPAIPLRFRCLSASTSSSSGTGDSEKDSQESETSHVDRHFGQESPQGY